MQKPVEDLRQHIRLFHGVSNDDYARLTLLLHRVRCRAGKTLLRVGGNIGKVFFVIRGEVHVIGESTTPHRANYGTFFIGSDGAHLSFSGRNRNTVLHRPQQETSVDAK